MPHIVGSGTIPETIVACDGGDRVAALIYDLTSFVAPILREQSNTFYSIIRRGARSYSIE
jgi:purine nucleoside phosphorylase